MKKTNTTLQASAPAMGNIIISAEMMVLHEASYQQMTQLLAICSRKIDSYSTDAEAFEALKIRELQCLVKVTLQLQGNLSDFISEREATILQRDNDLKTAINTGRSMPKSSPVTKPNIATGSADFTLTPYKEEVSIAEAVGNFHQWESGKKPKQNLLSQGIPSSFEGSQSPF